jgi:hypothetical protein
MTMMIAAVETYVVLPEMPGEESGVGTTFGEGDVKVDATDVAVIPDRVTVTVGAGCEAVAVWVGD